MNAGRKPEWLRMQRQGGADYNDMKRLLRTSKLNTVCESANCPNRGECFNSRTATFMLLGEICTRHCTFCNIPGGRVAAVDADEPRRVAEAGGLASIGDTLPGVRTQAPKAQPPAAPAPVEQITPGGVGSAPKFDPAVYTVPAGQAGWALHVYSLPDSAGASAQAAELERAGYRTAVRIVEIKDKGGRWWRLYVGSFPSRAAARAAMPALLARLGATWAEPARIQESAP